MREFKLINNSKRLVTLKSPLIVVWEVTPICQYNCVFCYSNYDRGHALQHPSLDHAKKILNSLHEASVFELKLEGGEVTAYPFLKELLNEAHRLGFHLSAISNGCNVNKDLFDCFGKYNMSVAFSLHGPMQEVHDEITQTKGSFENVMRSMLAMVDRGISIHLMYSPIFSNYKYIYKTILMLNESGINISYLQVHRMVPQGACQDKIGEYIIGIREYNDIFRQLERIETEFGIDCEITDALPFCKFAKKYQKFLHPCPYGVTHLKINWKGDVAICPCSHYFIGNILEEDLSDLWENNKLLLEYRYLEWVDSKCKKCKQFDLCLGGCRQTSPENKMYSIDCLIKRN